MNVLITGAGSGIGAALATAFLHKGFDVTGTVRDPQRAQTLSQDTRLTYLPLQLHDKESISRLIAAVVQRGGVDILVNNAGAGLFGAVEDVDEQDAQRHFELNVLAPLSLTRGLLPMLRQRHGRIAWIGSLAGRFAMPFQAHYSATKAAVALVSDALRMELGPLGVQVTCIEAGDFRTAFTNSRMRVAQQTSAYEPNVEHAFAAVQRTELEAPLPDKMANEVVRLLMRKRLPARYPVGPNATLLTFLGRLLPDVLRERLVRSVYNV